MLSLLGKKFSEKEELQIKIDPKKLKIIYITQDSCSDFWDQKNKWYEKFPTFWAFYDKYLLYCEVEFNFGILEDLSDLELNTFKPGKKELEFIIKHPIRYSKASIEIFDDPVMRDEISDYEYNILLTWSRDNKINKIIDGK
jgi:hypothetical protein